MGKKTKKTRWRALTLNGHQSDSEGSSTKSSLQTTNTYQHKYSKFPFSSQSSPIRKFQHESSKSTRSNSTTSEHKITFNEDEYTRITTPRQDVLFKKGYLNKPKNYQTQTSTGTSSTANSTSTCTPDHQSADGTEGTDLEYESQFVFPNGFVDQNGIYYINSYEAFPFVVFNAPLCYTEYPNLRNKRYSTDSMAESISPNNEEVNPELSNNLTEERLNNTPVLAQTYVQTTDYCNEENGTTDGQNVNEEPRRLKKKRRKKISSTKSNCENGTSPSTTDNDSSHEIEDEPTTEQTEESKPNPNDAQNLLLQSLLKNANNEKESAEENNAKYSLKPDAEEFIPRTLRAPEMIPFDPNLQFLNFSPNFIPIPFVGELQRPQFLPPGIPVNFIPSQEPKPALIINSVPNHTDYSSKPSEQHSEADDQNPTPPIDTNKANTPLKNSPQTPKDIDIAKIVSKLEEAAKQQQIYEKRHQNVNRPNNLRSYQPHRPRYNRGYHEHRYEKSPEKLYHRQQSKQSQDNSPVKDSQIKNQRKEQNSRISENCTKSKNSINQFEPVKKNDALKNKAQNHSQSPNAPRSPEQKPKPSKAQNQWISVSSRKKKKNKVANDEQDVIEIENDEADQNDDLFESFDINQLIDVVPPSKLETHNDDIKVEGEKPKEEVLETPLKKKPVDHKKKSKKAPTKRIMITDPTVIQPNDDPATPSSPKETPAEVEAVAELPINKVTESETAISTPEKKSKKKKKKPAKPTLIKIQSVSSSNTTLSNIDDSYEFLLESSILEDFEQKTNIEISQELDKMIQKGLYSNLEEKVKSLNLNEIDDRFFETLNYSTPSQTREKFGTIKATNFYNTLENSAKTYSEEIDNNLINIDFSKIKLPDLEPQPSTSKSGNFLGTEGFATLKNEPTFKKQTKSDTPEKKEKGEPQNSSLNLNTKNLTTSKNFSSHEVIPSEPQTSQVLLRESPTKQDNMYPITTAVKDWMIRTRESAPDVKLLKSPNTIFKELLETEADPKNVFGNPRPVKSVSRETSPKPIANGSGVSNLANDEEVTIWSADGDWDNDLQNSINEIKGSIHNGREARLNGHIEECEEAIEVYESKYGKNEDILKIKAEIEEYRKNRSFPRHGNLPYRAICCSIM